MVTFAYRAVRIRQTNTGDPLVLFAAPATEIDTWAGVPQKKELSDSEETTGFQREVNPKRLRSLAEFYRDEKNIIQNPLLCARRETTQGSVVFEPDGQASEEDQFAEWGTVSITTESLEEQELLSLLKRVKEDLERRVPALRSHQIPDQRLLRLKQRAKVEYEEFYNVGDEAQVDLDAQAPDEEGTEEDMSSVLFDESHIFDFWEQIAARAQVLEEIGGSFSGSGFLGFSKEAMISFLRPVVVVDGQHRLRGAIEAAKALTGSEPYLSQSELAVLEGKDPNSVQRELERLLSRKLPVSLLMTDDPAEQVFQFVVVNQKATPIGRALLGTIVSTSLSNEELERVSVRLSNAGIPLEESRAVAYLTRHPDSPFSGLVEKGLTSDSKNLLPWSVLVSLVKIFRELKGGRLFHERNDYADKWRRYYLNESGIVSGWQERGYDTAFKLWSASDGPWRDVFIAFWVSVRDILGNTNDEQAWNFWGAARESNFFNKVSLIILAADFFQYLSDRQLGIDNSAQVPQLVEDWLRGVSRNYFNRDWNLSGVKKDSTGIRNRWSKEWAQYRKDPQRLPDTRLYRQPATND